MDKKCKIFKSAKTANDNDTTNKIQYDYYIEICQNPRVLRQVVIIQEER